MGVYIRALRDIAGRADTAADLAHNRIDPLTNDEHYDEAVLEKVYAQGVDDLCGFLLDGVLTEGLKLVLRAGRAEGDDLPADDPDLGYPPVNPAKRSRT